MRVTIEIPDALAARLIPVGQDPARAVLEDALVEAYREERISARELREALGIATRYELDGFLKARRVWMEYSDEMNAEDEKFQPQFVQEYLRKSA